MKQISDVDVVVAGGGPAGIGAAIAAARAGAKTLLLERHAFFGGVAAWGMGMPINQMRPDNQARGAVHELVIERLQAYGDEAVHVIGHALVCNVEFLKVAVMDALDAVGCDYLVHSRVADAVIEGDRVAGVVAATKEGLVRIGAKAVVDATGDADVACYAGAETLKGRDSDGFLSPMTLLVLIVNVDTEGAREFAREGGVGKLIKKAREKYPLLPETLGLGPVPIDNCLVINHAGTKLHRVLDGSDASEMSEAERYSRRQAIQIVQALREFGGPAFQNVQLGTTGPQVGVRETRRLKGEYILTEEDAKTAPEFADAIAWRSGMLDIGFVRLDKMAVHGVPYRALLPEKVDGLLAAGRCISATHVAASAGKSMGNCMATGHAAGLAAAMSAKKRCTPRELDVKKLRDALTADGVDLCRPRGGPSAETR